jgi:hypothetical protein
MATLVDFHAHFYSRTVFEVLAAASPLKGTSAERLERVTRSLGLDLPSPDPAQHLARWLEEMEHHGVGHMVLFASVPEEAAVLASLAAQVRGRISPFALVDPLKRDAARHLAVQLEEQGFRGALFFPAQQRYRLDGPECQAVFEVLAACEAPAVVHCGLLRMPLRERFGLPRCWDPACADPLALAIAADRHPALPFVIPHFGAGFLGETLLLGAQCPNVYVDTSSSNSWLATQPARLSLADVFERVLGVFGPERVLFGTDSSTFPRGWRREVLLAQREALGACGVHEEDQARIFGLNASRLLRLGA